MEGTRTVRLDVPVDAHAPAPGVNCPISYRPLRRDVLWVDSILLECDDWNARDSGTRKKERPESNAVPGKSSALKSKPDPTRTGTPLLSTFRPFVVEPLPPVDEPCPKKFHC